MAKCPEVIIHTELEIIRLEVDSGLESKVTLARKFAGEFFSQTQFSETFSDPIAWAFYDRFFLDVALPYTKYETVLEKCRSAKSIKGQNLPPDLLLLLKFFCRHHKIPLSYEVSISLSQCLSQGLKKLAGKTWNLFLILYSLGSLAYLSLLRPKKLIAVWTGDYLGKSGNMDPRLGDLEKKLTDANISAIPFIRSTGVSLKLSIKNFFKRRGPMVYYEQLEKIFMVGLAEWHEPNGRSFFETTFNGLYSRNAIQLNRCLKLWQFVFRRLQFQVFVSWFLSSRTASLIWGARKANVPSIGFMHGVSVMTYMGHEFMPEYNGLPIGPDYFGTWSKWWKSYFIENSRIYPVSGIEESGPLKPMTYLPNIENKKFHSKQKIFVISEAHLPVAEIVPYLERMASDPTKEIIFKVRPFGVDVFWEKLTQHPIYKKYRFQKSNLPTPICFEGADIVIGTHSTAVLETLALNKPILLLNTPKWGDYFDINSFFQNSCPFWVNSPDQINQKIQETLEAKNFVDWQGLYEKFFGRTSGTDWIIAKIQMLLKS